MVRAKRRTGLDPLSYLGVEPVAPSNFIVQKRDPTTADYNEYNLGDEWLNILTIEVWKLVRKNNLVATWIQFGGTGTDTTFVTDSGNAIPALNILNVVGTGSINTLGSGNTLTINGISGGIFMWVETDISLTMDVQMGYITTSLVGAVSLQLPTTSVIGDVIRVAGLEAGGWSITQAAGQYINFISQATTPGVGGSLSSTVQYDAVELLCIDDDLGWNVISSVGNITVV